MVLRRYQWVLGIVWLIVAGLVAFRDVMLPVAVTERIKPGNEWLIVTMAVVFAMWNAARWYGYAHRSRRPYQSPFRTRRYDESGGKPSTSSE